MAAWFDERIVATGRLPLFCLFAGVIVGFLIIRLSTRMIRAQVSWWPGNVTPGGTHIHHVVFGVVFMVVAGIGAFAISERHTGWTSVAAAVFGIGTALVLDEFALILHLEDVYWSEEGRSSVDAVFIAVALTGLALLGVQPVVFQDVANVAANRADRAALAVAAAVLLANLVLATVTLLKGKLWTGLIGLFVPFLLIVGAVRVARPRSPWAHRRYPPHSRRMARAVLREHRYRDPMIRLKDRVQDAVSGLSLPNPPPGGDRGPADRGRPSATDDDRSDGPPSVGG